ncbi:MAG: T9SS type A sorting domain-containing protein [Bacteroidota bacterium]
MKRLFLLLMVSFLIVESGAQSIDDPFFDKVSYVGAFGSNNWTSGWTNWDPVNSDYPVSTVTKGNGVFTSAGGLRITADETWSGVIKLDGWVYVDDGATLTIEPGTIIRGTEKSVLVVEMGSKINAVGTPSDPIVFTSAKGAGFRANSDWAGLVICGKAPNNLAGGQGTAEGGIESMYGGSDPNDNSGKLKYVRIEFPGYEVATGKEINGLSLYSVGKGTEIDHIQVSYSGDDAFEWFGGTVNAKYLVCFATEDDNFDTDNGYVGMVQYGLIARDSSIVDTDAANGFESDNDENGSENTPLTHAIFSNITAIGPAESATEPAALRPKHSEGSAMRIRRNSRLQIYNSVFLGFGNGLRIESSLGWAAAQDDNLTVKNSIIAGVRNKFYKAETGVMTETELESWYLNASRENRKMDNNTDVMLADPYNYASRNFMPQSGSPVYNSSYWFKEYTGEGPSIDDPFFDQVDFVGAFGDDDWTAGWTNWDPVNTEYPAATVTKGNGVFTQAGGTYITSNEVWSGNIKLDGWVYVNNGATLTILPGTIIRGTEKSVLVIERGAKIEAVGTPEEPIVFTSNKGAGFRANSDWAGVVLCGYGINNVAGGEGVAEGGIGSLYGGTNAADNSGKMKYVRIEFPGYEVATGKEINGLTLCSVGSGTEIDHIQISYSGDDAFEWFGGSVNAKYLVCMATEDDNFDTDNGYVGMVQYGVIARDSSIVDTDAANGFESDNDENGSENTPLTHAVFSNITAIGPAKSATEPATLRPKHAEGSAMRIRRNSRLQIYNAAFAGFGNGLRLESSLGWAAAQDDNLTVQNSFIAGIRGKYYKAEEGVMTETELQDWFLDIARRNKAFSAASDLMMNDPFNYDARNFIPEEGSPLRNASYWTEVGIDKAVVSRTGSLSCYPNPFNGSTRIDIELDMDAQVVAEVYDMTGKKVAILFDGYMSQGVQTLEFDATLYGSGLYIGRIKAGDQLYSVKMIAR